jgi:hypothetical protein
LSSDGLWCCQREPGPIRRRTADGTARRTTGPWRQAAALRSSLIAGTPSSAKVSGLDLLVTIRLAANHCLGGSFLPVDDMPSRILGRRSRSRPAAAKRAANGGGLEGDRRPRHNALPIGKLPNLGQYPSRQVPAFIHQNIFGSPTEWFLPLLMVTSSTCSCRFRGSLRGRDIARPTMVSESCGVSM